MLIPIEFSDELLALARRLDKQLGGFRMERCLKTRAFPVLRMHPRKVYTKMAPGAFGIFVGKLLRRSTGGKAAAGRTRNRGRASSGRGAKGASSR